MQTAALYTDLVMRSFLLTERFIFSECVVGFLG